MFRKLIPLLAFVFGVGLSVHAQNPPPVQGPPPAQTPPPAAPAGQGGRGAGSGQLTVWAPHTVPVEPIDQDLVARIKAEGMERSKVMWITHYLTDTFGPRPIGSPNHKAAAEWAIKTMASWGLKNPHLEPFTWRGIGWLPGRASGFMTAPNKANLKFETIPWSPSTKGTVSGEVVYIVAPENPTEAELSAFLANLAPKVKGGIVMVGAPVPVAVNFTEPQKRVPDDQAKARFLPPDPNALARGGRGGVGGPGGGRGGRGATAPAVEGRLTAQQVSQRISALLRDNPPALRLTQGSAGDARRVPGVIVAQNGPGQTYDEASQLSPGVILRYDDYGRIARLISEGLPVSVEFNITNQYFPEGSTSYVAVAEIPGTDKADEVVILGGHLDSWTSATGATDDAVGCAIMMEAVRILQATGVKPRRTIRVALWSGEEEGLLGSVAYVKAHFGTAEAPKPEFSKLSAYWNVDDGTGRLIGASVFGPAEAGIIVAQLVKPFEEWGIYGASATTSRSQGGSDYGAFNEAGLPGINTLQDPIEYNSTTWHTNLDTYERIVPDDVMKASVISASVAIHLANREKLLPRFASDAMPAMPAGRGGGAGGGAGRGGPAGPTAQAHTYATAKNKALTVAAPGLLPSTPLAAGAGAGAPAPTAAVGTAPAHGTLALRADGSFVYTPAKDFVGTDTFTYTITVGGTASAPATVTVAVR